MSIASITAMAAKALEVLLDQSCTVTTPGDEVDDAAGGTTPGTTSSQTVICRVDTPSGSDQTVAERLGVVMDTIIMLKAGTVVSPRATIAVNGHTYDVTYSNEDASNQTVTRCGCRRVMS